MYVSKIIHFFSSSGQRDNETDTIGDEEEKRLSLAYERLHNFPKTLLDQFSVTIHTLDISHNEFE